MAGLGSSRVTTTFTVADLAVTRAEFDAALIDYYDRAWHTLLTLDEVREEADELLHFATSFDVGEVLERRGDVIRPRSVS